MILILQSKISVYVKAKSKIKNGQHVKELKEYFDKRFNELKNSLDVNDKTLENFKSKIKLDF